VLTAQQLTRIEGLVRNAVGLDVERGDDITIVSIPFDAVASPLDPVVEGPGIMQQLPQYQRPFVTVIALILAFILALKTLRAVKTAPPLPRQRGPVPALEGGHTAALDSVDSALKQAPRPKLPENQHAQALARSAETPDTAARVIRAWLKES
jgi:flagellar M-ring protein FliF